MLSGVGLMRWIFYSLFVLNAMVFAGFFFVISPDADVQFVESVPTDGAKVKGSIVLLGEQESGGREGVDNTKIADQIESIPSTTEQVPQEPMVSDRETEETMCYRLGPFNSHSAAEGYQVDATIDNGIWKIDSKEESTDMRFWVYVPAAATKEEALATLKSLQVLGVDSFVVSKGEFANAISLGMFKKSDSANVLRSKVAALGFNVEVDQKSNIKRSYWLYLKVPSGSQQKVLETQVKNKILSSVFSCEMFAQDKIFP